MIPNNLVGEKSPYLLQHLYNPVDWYPWVPRAFERARLENKPIFLSIGYSTCYWCHVMEHDSFEQVDVAQALKDFVCIKVDREERPDVDAVYMEAVIAFSGHGGWPMSVFLTPELKPFFGGTFFYRTQFLEIAKKISESWKQSSAEIRSSAEKVVQFLKQENIGGQAEFPQRDLATQAVKAYAANYDARYGGFGSAPKFPPAAQLSLILRMCSADVTTKNEQDLELVENTLRRMAYGGIYDHISGGFSRYSTDERWLVPHFEKMLYDNALLAWSYLEAAQVTGDQYYGSVASSIFNYVLSQMTSPQGGFYTAEDAGEVEREGEFYTFSYNELTQILSAQELARLGQVFDLPRAGNFEGGKIILSRLWEVRWEESCSAEVKVILARLKDYRATRARPRLDDKILTSWNGLMISSLAKGYRVLAEPSLLSAAQHAATFIRSELFNGEILLRRYRAGQAAIDGFFEDYAFMIEGLLHLYQADFNFEWLEFARRLQAILDLKFWDGVGYKFSTAPELIVDQRESFDNATPSAVSVTALNLLMLEGYYGDPVYHDRFVELVKGVSGKLRAHPSAFPRLLWAIDLYYSKLSTVVIVPGTEGQDSDNFKAALAEINRKFLPNMVIALGSNNPQAPPIVKNKVALGGLTTFYLCQGQSCQEPVTSLLDLLALLRGEVQPYQS